MEAINATRTTTIVPTWGYEDPKTGDFSGMIGQLLKKEADIGGTSMFFMSERVPLVDYISMTTPTSLRFVFRSPPLSYTANIYYLPFSSTVWICSIFLVILCTIVVYITSGRVVSRGETFSSASDFALMAISTVCQMGSQLKTSRLPGRISTVSFILRKISSNLPILN